MSRFIRHDIMDYEYRKGSYTYYVNDHKPNKITQEQRHNIITRTEFAAELAEYGHTEREIEEMLGV